MTFFYFDQFSQKKRLTFKDDDQLITKYNYPSEDSFEDLDSFEDFDSLDRLRSGPNSDSDSSSTFDNLQDYEADNVASVSTLRSSGSQVNGTRIILAGSTSSAATSSTLKGSIGHQQKHSDNSSLSPSRYNHGNSSTGIMLSSSRLNNNNSSKWPNVYMSKPIVLTPSKSGSKSRKITCKTAKL